MRKNQYIRWLLIVFIALNIYSLVPVVMLYLEDVPAVGTRNENVVESLAANKDPYFSFIVISDTGSGIFPAESATLKLIAQMNREDRFKKVPIDFVLNVGDVTFRGRESHYRNYLKIKKKIKFPVIDAIGNHDDDFDNGPRGLALFNKYCGAEEFSFAERNSYFIVLDNKDGDFTEEQFRWFENELRKSKSYKHTFVFIHKPPFNPFQQSWYRVETNPWSHRFLKVCDEHEVDIVFSGHEGVTRVAKFGSVTYIVSGGGGTPLLQPSSEGGFLNYIFVKVNGDYIDYEVRKVNPPAWELFAYYVWKDLVYFVRDLLLQ